MKKLFVLCLAVILASFAAPALFAQNTLLSNPNYQKSLDMKTLAERAFAAGDFEKSMEYSAEAERLSKLARSESETERLRFLSYSRLRRATARVDFCEKQDAATRYPTEWTAAQGSFATAKSSFDVKAYQPSIDASEEVIKILSVVMPKTQAPAAKAPADPPAAAAPAPDKEALPASYIVRLIPEKRDCLWRIAAYPFVYGDPLKWKLLYEANKDKLTNAGNPDLIHPGLSLSIPSASGEKREGVWQK